MYRIIKTTDTTQDGGNCC